MPRANEGAIAPRFFQTDSEACLLACLPAYLLTCLPACEPQRLTIGQDMSTTDRSFEQRKLPVSIGTERVDPSSQGLSAPFHNRCAMQEHESYRLCR